MSDAELDEKGRKKTVDISIVEMDDLCKQYNLKSKSDMIRWLHGQEYAPSGIARFLGVRYQHVRNVISRPLKRGPRT